MEPSDFLKIKEDASSYLTQHGLGPEEQTRISLFLQGIKNNNALIVSRIEFQSVNWVAYNFLHKQWFKELELSTLLFRTTKWSTNPFLYMDVARLQMDFWQKARLNDYLTGFFSLDRRFYEYLALSHAFLSEIRFISLLPPDTKLEDPFLMALYDIEIEHGRQIQTQIRLLKDMETSLPIKEKEKVVERQRNLVAEHYCNLLASLYSQ